MWFAIGFGAACVLGAYFYPSAAVWLVWVPAVLSMLFVVCSRWIRTLRVIAIVLFSFSLGILWFRLYDSCYLREPRQLDGTTTELLLEVADYSYQTDYGCAAAGTVKLSGKTYRLVLYLDDPLALQPGDQIYGSFCFRFTSEGGVEEPTYHRSEGTFLLAYQQAEVYILEGKNVAWHHYPALWRRTILNRIDEIFPSDTAAFVKALLLGDRSGIDYEMSTAFKVSGISHIVAVSGLHVSILFAAIYLVTFRKRLLSFIVGTAVLLIFAAVAGFTPSINRACIMQFLVLLAILVNREYDPPTALSFSALVMLVFNPMVVTSISFQLSVGSMTGIFLFYKGIHDWILDKDRLGAAKGRSVTAKVKRYFASSVAISLGAGVVTTPLVAYHFGVVSLIGILTNLLILWLLSTVFYGAVIALFVSLTGIYVGKLAAFIVVLPVRFIIGLAKKLSAIPLAAVYTRSSYIVVWLVFVYVMLAVFLLLKKKPAAVFISCCTISLCAALAASWLEPLTDDCRVTVLDVGQGQSILLQSEGRTFLVDCGGENAAQCADLAAETLLSQGIDHLDGIILTHFDADHAGAVPYLLTRISADRIFLPFCEDADSIGAKIKKLAGDIVVSIDQDLSFSYGSSKMTLFAPELFDSGNESSMCVLFQTENCDILVTGDRGSLGEMLLLSRTQLPELEVLVAGHHGSAGSTGEAFLEALRPDTVLISAGKNNPYGHPASALLERLARYGCAVYRTDLNGTIVYRR